MISRVVLLRFSQIVIDLGVFALALWVACLLRFEGDIPNQVFKRMLFLAPYIVEVAAVFVVTALEAFRRGHDRQLVAK